MKTNIDEWKSPKEKLDYFLNLYSKIKSDKMLMFTISKRLELNAEMDEAMEWLNWHRNMFIHFVPSTFEVNVVHFPKRMLLIMGIMKFLVSESGNILWLYLEEKELTEQLIASITELFIQLSKNYTSE